MECCEVKADDGLILLSIPCYPLKNRPHATKRWTSIFQHPVFPSLHGIELLHSQLFSLMSPNQRDVKELMPALRESDSVIGDLQKLHRLKPLQGISLFIVILAAMSLRLSFMNDGLWLDEAWVANSVIAPSISDMLFYDDWVQTTPPLLLLLMRSAVACFGTNEVVLRSVAWIAGLLSILAMGYVLSRIFRFPMVILGTTFFAANYWALKYSQQAKQYSTDLLFSCLFMAVTLKILESGRTSWLYWTIAGIGLVGVFISYTSIFWFPTVIIVVALSRSRPPKTSRVWYKNILRTDWLFLVMLYGAGFSSLYFLFVIPNSDPILSASWQNYFLGREGFFQSFARYSATVCDLLVPRTDEPTAVSYGIMALVLVGTFRAIIGTVFKDRRSFHLLLLLIVPIVASGIASFLRQYPLLYYTRFVIWMLPALVVLLIYAVEPAWIGFEHWIQEILSKSALNIFIVMLCVLYILANLWFMNRHPQSREEVREAVQYLQERMGPSDILFVHGANEQQFVYYTRYFNWFPQTSHMGATEWPCCSRNRSLRISNPQANSLEEDLKSFLHSGRNRKVWLLLPAANDPRHWTWGLRKIIKSVPVLMSKEGYKEIEKKEFRNALVYAYACSIKESLF